MTSATLRRICIAAAAVTMLMSQSACLNDMGAGGPAVSEAPVPLNVQLKQKEVAAEDAYNVILNSYQTAEPYFAGRPDFKAAADKVLAAAKGLVKAARDGEAAANASSIDVAYASLQDLASSLSDAIAKVKGS